MATIEQISHSWRSMKALSDQLAWLPLWEINTSPISRLLWRWAMAKYLKQDQVPAVYKLTP